MNVLRVVFISLLSVTPNTQAAEVSPQFYYESRDFKNSAFKIDGDAIGAGLKFQHDNHSFRGIYEYAAVNTKQPPKTSDSKERKLHLQYGYRINPKFKVTLNYIDVLEDNMVPANLDILSYGAGLGYQATQQLSVDFNQYHTDYSKFKINQSDIALGYAFKVNNAKIKTSAMVKYLDLSNQNNSVYSKNAEGDYLTFGVKLATRYQGYQFGVSGFFGKRAFAVMQDGFKIQQRAMEFDRTYALAIGKKFDDLSLRARYVYQRATELPPQNPNVDVCIIGLDVEYKF